MEQDSTLRRWGMGGGNPTKSEAPSKSFWVERHSWENHPTKWHVYTCFIAKWRPCWFPYWIARLDINILPSESKPLFRPPDFVFGQSSRGAQDWPQIRWIGDREGGGWIFCCFTDFFKTFNDGIWWTPKKLENDSSSCAQDISNAFQCQFVSKDCPGWINHQVLQEAAWGSVPGKAQLSVYRRLREEWACGVGQSFVCPSIGWREKFAGMTTPVSKIFPENNPLTTNKFRNRRICLWSILAMMHRFYVAKGLLALRLSSTGFMLRKHRIT